MKKLYRSTSDRMIAGVCGGVAVYLNMDSTVVRLITVLLLLVTGLVPVGILYLIAAIIVPEQDGTKLY